MRQSGLAQWGGPFGIASGQVGGACVRSLRRGKLKDKPGPNDSKWREGGHAEH